MHPHVEGENLGSSKIEKYNSLYKIVKSFVDGENDDIANMANVASIIHKAFSFWWTGFYRVIDGELVLGPFQGPVACTRIAFGRGVCGSAWKQAETLVVPDVDEFPGHIACSSASKSEIVVPIKKGGEVVGVLDIDSQYLGTFDEIDKEYLEKIVDLL
ncbi:MAG: GAF domain-containing protein [Bacteroidales bacterium]|nr:GAF domain-containing protein [Bacteroidales bacterium]